MMTYEDLAAVIAQLPGFARRQQVRVWPNDDDAALKSLLVLRVEDVPGVGHCLVIAKTK
jgi:hypothetical protein